MNNSWYVVKSQVINDSDTNELLLMFRHPCEPGAGESGWMEPSTEIRMEQAKRSSTAPQKQFTREEIESHSSERDCWIVINDKVYDATSVLSWHPGGITPILDHAGRVHSETTEAFESIHDDFAQKKLQGAIKHRGVCGISLTSAGRMRLGGGHRQSKRIYETYGRAESQTEGNFSQEGYGNSTEPA